MIKPQFKTFIRGEKVYRNDDSINTIDSPEALAALIAEETGDAGGGGGAEPSVNEEKTVSVDAGSEEVIDENITEAEALKLIKNETQQKKPDDAEKKDSEGSGEEGTESKKEHKNGEEEVLNHTDPLAFLNEKYNLNLNPENFASLTEVEKTEAIGEIFESFVTQAQQGIESLKEVKKIIETDEEVMEFIKAKSEGKTMKDFVNEFASTPEGAPDDDLVRAMMKRNSVLDDEAIEDSIKSLKDKGKFNAVVEKARELAKQEEAAAVQEAQAKKEEALSSYKDYLQAQEKTMGLQLTDELKARLYETISEVDENGMNALGKALQSEENILKASIAIFALDEVVEKLSTNKGNKKKNSLLERLSQDPAELQGDTAKQKDTKSKKEEDYIALANSF